jgi:hypothetical protein
VNQPEGGKVYFDSHYQRIQSMDNLLHCFWACGKAEDHGREYEKERERERERGEVGEGGERERKREREREYVFVYCLSS